MGMNAATRFKIDLHDFSAFRHIDLHGGTAPNISSNDGAKIPHVNGLISLEQPVVSSKERARNMAFFVALFRFLSRKKFITDDVLYPSPLQKSRSSFLLSKNFLPIFCQIVGLPWAKYMPANARMSATFMLPALSVAVVIVARTAFRFYILRTLDRNRKSESNPDTGFKRIL